MCAADAGALFLIPMSSPDPSDSELLQDFVRSGSQSAFRKLTERFAGLVFSVAFRRTGRRGLAEEVAQNVFAVMARKAAALAGPDVRLAAWLHRAAVLESARALRKESIRQRIMDDYFRQAEVLSAEDAAVWRAVLPELDSALDSLPARDRELLMARFFDDRSYQEIAGETGRSVAALMQQQHRALERLEGLLRRRGVTASGALLAAGLGAVLQPSAQAVPAGLAASLAASAPAAAAALGPWPVLIHSIDILMQTKSRMVLGAAVAACFLAASGGFWVGKSRAEARGMAGGVPAPEVAVTVVRPPAEPSGGVVAAAVQRLDIREKLARAVAGWRGSEKYPDKVKALEVLDALSPEDVPVALEVLSTVKDDYGLHLALGKRIAILWGAREPAPALQWLVGELPREHRGEPIQAILADWSKREPVEALAWWEGIAESLDFPVPEDQFERFEQVVYSGWAINDPDSLARQIPEMASPDEVERLEDESVGMKLMGLATAAVDPATRAATLAAIARIQSEGARAAAAGTAATMMNVADAAAGRDFLDSLRFEDASIRADLLGGAAMMGVIMQQQSAEEAVGWLRGLTDEATARRVVDDFLKESDP